MDFMNLMKLYLNNSLL
jgi:vacuolar protein sorting-associated protein 26